MLLLKISAANPLINPIFAANFDNLSVSSGGQGPYLAAAHVMNTPNSAGTSSAWVAANEVVAAPEPEVGFAAGLFAVGIGVMAVRPKRLVNSPVA